MFLVYDLNRILTGCLVSDRRGNNLHTFHTVEIESDLYSGVMRARCYPFNMAGHRFRGKNVKVCHLRALRSILLAYLQNILGLVHLYTRNFNGIYC